MPGLHLPSEAVAPSRTTSSPRTDRARARRRRALLELARRNGQVRVAVREGGRALPHAAEVLDLLDELNTSGQLSYGGFVRTDASAAFLYRPV